MVNAGITTVIAKDLYRDIEEVLGMPDVKVSITTTKDGFHELKYTV
jgi:hypothetical protein